MIFEVLKISTEEIILSEYNKYQKSRFEKKNESMIFSHISK